MGELKVKCEQFLDFKQYQPFQRNQLSLNEAARRVLDLKEATNSRNRNSAESKSLCDNSKWVIVKNKVALKVLLEPLCRIVMNQELINS